MKIQKLDPMGEPISDYGDMNDYVPKQKERLVGVLYGHTKGGKVYNYKAGGNFRTGDTITPKVTHWKSGKVYNTLGRIVSTRDFDGSAAGRTKSFLGNKDIGLKSLEPTNQTSLPGYVSRKEKDPNFTARQWAEEAKERERASINARMRKVNSMGAVVK